MSDGHLNKCKACKCAYQASRPKEKLLEIDRRRNQKPARKRARVEHSRRARSRAPDKYKARTALNNALRDGRINKPECCTVCSSTERVEAHHDDYSKPLDVKWFCRSCHFRHHAELKELQNEQSEN